MENTDYGVTFLENCSSFAIFTDKDNTMTWDEAVENLKWLMDNEVGFSD